MTVQDVKFDSRDTIQCGSYLLSLLKLIEQCEMKLSNAEQYLNLHFK